MHFQLRRIEQSIAIRPVRLRQALPRWNASLRGTRRPFGSSNPCKCVYADFSKCIDPSSSPGGLSVWLGGLHPGESSDLRNVQEWQKARLGARRARNIDEERDR